jgi:hypothetical protein
MELQMNENQFKAVTQCAGAKLRLPELVDLEIDILAVNITVWSNSRKIESRHNTQAANRSKDCGQVQKGAHFPNVISNESASIPCDTVKRGKVTTNLMADEASQKTLNFRPKQREVGKWQSSSDDTRPTVVVAATLICVSRRAFQKL